MTQLIVRRGEHTLEVRRDGACVAWFPVGVGRSDRPTPAGIWTLSAGARPGDPDVVAVLSTPGLTCLRATADLASLGRDESGG